MWINTFNKHHATLCCSSSEPACVLCGWITGCISSPAPGSAVGGSSYPFPLQNSSNLLCDQTSGSSTCQLVTLSSCKPCCGSTCSVLASRPGRPSAWPCRLGSAHGARPRTALAAQRDPGAVSRCRGSRDAEHRSTEMVPAVTFTRFRHGCSEVMGSVAVCHSTGNAPGAWARSGERWAPPLSITAPPEAPLAVSQKYRPFSSLLPRLLQLHGFAVN